MNVYDHRLYALTLPSQGELRNKEHSGPPLFRPSQPGKGQHEDLMFLQQNSAINGANMLLCGAACPGQTRGFLSHPSKFRKNQKSTLAQNLPGCQGWGIAGGHPWPYQIGINLANFG